jgi:hypothetical protein
MVFVAAGVLLLGACGGDSSSNSSSGTTTTASSGGNDNTTTTGGSDGTDTTADLGDLLASGECDSVASVLGAGLAQALSQGGDVDLDKAANALKEFADNAPGEIKEDAQTVADAYSEFVQALNDAGIDFKDPSSFSDPSKLQQLEDAANKIDTDAVKQASDNVEAYFKQHCGG